MKAIFFLLCALAMALSAYATNSTEFSVYYSHSNTPVRTAYGQCVPARNSNNATITFALVEHFSLCTSFNDAQCKTRSFPEPLALPLFPGVALPLPAGSYKCAPLFNFGQNQTRAAV